MASNDVGAKLNRVWLEKKKSGKSGKVGRYPDHGDPFWGAPANPALASHFFVDSRWVKFDGKEGLDQKTRSQVRVPLPNHPA